MSTDERFTVRSVHPDMAGAAASMVIEYRQVASRITASIPDGRLRSLALTELESSFNWAMRALAEASWSGEVEQWLNSLPQEERQRLQNAIWTKRDELKK